MSQYGPSCPTCGTALRLGASFCGICGNPVTYNPKPAGGASGFCGQCGATLAAKYSPCPKCGYVKTRYNPGKSRSTRRVMIPIIVITGLVITLIGLDLYATQSLEMQSKGVTNSDMSTFTIHFELSIYNPTVIPTSFDVIYADMLYKSRTLGTATLSGKYLPPSSSTDVSGKFEIDPMAVLGAMSGGTPNENDFNIEVKLEKRLIGLIPFTYEENYTAAEFREAFIGP